MVHTNGFEGRQLDFWDRQTGGDGNTGFELGLGTANSGQNNGWLYASQGWAREGTWAAINGTSANSVCSARVHARPFQDLEFALRIWDARGNKLADVTTWLTANGRYQAVSTATWSPWGNTNVFAEAVIGSYGAAKTVRVDDLTVQCGTDSSPQRASRH
ncbi:hypothetical protein M1P56_17495 [Streptomyces sp. HU2014]|uniref:hypothetical protein n=1 Tax=Streptomyces sp. HU2014 TaxID=2939414 RepID=UPI00200DD542|nr:hypothetical protein [Streptomyces sp. HU2014]UQI46016.1 hypothetical protein M1P56_17495 [Streptomyces sp. HU2014]